VAEKEAQWDDGLIPPASLDGRPCFDRNSLLDRSVTGRRYELNGKLTCRDTRRRRRTFRIRFNALTDRIVLYPRIPFIPLIFPILSA
jgi:hypothetical protein